MKRITFFFVLAIGSFRGVAFELLEETKEFTRYFLVERDNNVLISKEQFSTFEDVKNFCNKHQQPVYNGDPFVLLNTIAMCPAFVNGQQELLLSKLDFGKVGSGLWIDPSQNDGASLLIWLNGEGHTAFIGTPERATQKYQVQVELPAVCGTFR